MPPAVLREARKDDHRPAPRDHRRDRARPLKRSCRGREHHHPPDRPPRVCLPHRHGTHRTRQAHTLRTLPTPPRQSHLTHGNVRRVPYWRISSRVVTSHALRPPSSLSPASNRLHPPPTAGALCDLRASAEQSPSRRPTRSLLWECGRQLTDTRLSPPPTG